MRRGHDAARWGVWLAAAAIFLAPFIALLYQTEAGLIVMATALGTTSLLLGGALDAVPPDTRRWLRLMLVFNVVLLLACLLAAGWLIVRG
jgi:hypothetical protein